MDTRHYNARDIARKYILRGWNPTPVRPKAKAPKLGNWRTTTIAESEVDSHFSPGDNVGLVLGTTSGRLLDVDLDHPLARQLASQYLPETAAKFGRDSSPGSHWLYYVSTAEPKYARKNPDIVSDDDHHKVIVEMLCEGQQVVAPGSTHPSGERIAWVGDGEPARVEYCELKAAVDRLADEVERRLGLRFEEHNLSGYTFDSGCFGGDDRPGDDYNGRGDMRPILMRHGWQLVRGGENELWRRPGKSDGVSATLKDRVFYVHSSNAQPFESQRGYAPFSVFALLEHGGDFAAAAKRLSDEGYGRRSEPIKHREPPAPWKPFPLTALPDTLGLWAWEWSQSIPCDPAAMIPGMLAVVASAIGMSRRIHISNTWQEPCIVWSALVADSGSAKSPIMAAAVDYLDERERRHAAEYREAKRKYEAEKADYDRQMAIYRRGKSDVLPTAPTEPPRSHARLDDSTIDALAKVFADNPRGCLLARDEIAAWFGGFKRFSGGDGDAPAWLPLHGGRAFSIRRKTGNEAVYIPAAGLSITGTIQPGRLRALATAEHRDSGMLARFLLVNPPRIPKRLVDSMLAESTRERFGAMLNRLFTMDMAKLQSSQYEGAFDEFNGDLAELAVEPTKDDSPLKPIDIPMQAEAYERFARFVESHDEHTRSESGAMQASLAKLEGYVPRLALMFHLVRWAESQSADEPGPVELRSLEDAIEVVEWFRHEHERVYTLLGFTGGDEDDTALVDWIQSKGGTVTPRDLQRSPHGRKLTADEAELRLHAIASQGIGTWGQLPSNGGRIAYGLTLA